MRLAIRHRDRWVDMMRHVGHGDEIAGIGESLHQPTRELVEAAAVIHQQDRGTGCGARRARDMDIHGAASYHDAVDAAHRWLPLRWIPGHGAAGSSNSAILRA